MMTMAIFEHTLIRKMRSQRTMFLQVIALEETVGFSNEKSYRLQCAGVEYLTMGCEKITAL